MLKTKEITLHKTNIKSKLAISSTSSSTKVFLRFLLVIIFCNSISLTEEKFLVKRILENDSIVTMVINGGGTRQIFGDPFCFNHCSGFGMEIFIGDESQSRGVSKTYDLNAGDIIVKVKFSNDITSCAYMFYNMKYLLSVDFSSFISNRVQDTK